MKCPKCGNEVNQDEAFCGQCGTPMMPRSQAAQMVQAPRSGQLNSYNANMPPSSQPNKTGIVPPTNPYNPNDNNRPATYGGNPIAPNANQPSMPNHATGFYQDATEAMSAFPPGNTNQVYPPGYPQQGYAGTPIQGGYPGSGQYNPQVQPPMQAGNYTQHGFPQTPQFPAGQGYGYPIQPQPQPAPKKQNNTALIIASICLVVAILAVGVFGAFYLIRNHSSQPTVVTPVATSIPTPTVVPTPTPTPVATATPTPIPSPTVAPTPAPDANFSWCTTACTTNGFIVEYPNGWNQGQTSDKPGVQFLNPTPSDVYAAFKTPTPDAETATDLINGDLANFTSQPGYTAPTATYNKTIGGANWTYVIAHYTLNNQVERIEVFATVYQKKDYIIELQAAESQFDTTYYPTYFQKMINSFQFQQSTT